MVSGTVDVRYIEVPDVPEEEAAELEVNGSTEAGEGEPDEPCGAGDE